MIETIELADHSSYKDGIKSLLAIDLNKTVVLTVDMQYNYLEMDARG